jgi:hypothetical protein
LSTGSNSLSSSQEHHTLTAVPLVVGSPSLGTPRLVLNALVSRRQNSLEQPPPLSLLRDNELACKRCRLVIRRKRIAQRYCSKHCRDADAQRRKRARSADKKAPRGAPKRMLKKSPLPPYWEALTGSQNSSTKSIVCEAKNGHPRPLIGRTDWPLDILCTRYCRYLSKVGLDRQTWENIIRCETSSYPPLTGLPTTGGAK